MMMLVDCSGCHRHLQLPPGARSIRCVVCCTVTRILDHGEAPPPPPSQYYGCPAPPRPAAAASCSPSPYGPPGGPPASPHGRKKAVICGVSYRDSRYELNGCINDAKCMKYLLVNRFRFPEASIVMLTVELQRKKPIHIESQPSTIYEWHYFGLYKAVNLGTHWYFIILVMVYNKETTLGMKLMDMMKPFAPWTLKHRE